MSWHTGEGTGEGRDNRMCGTGRLHRPSGARSQRKEGGEGRREPSPIVQLEHQENDTSL